MADGPGYEVAHRRRREQKTDYKKRIELVKSGRLRAVIRKSNKHMLVQFVSYEKEGDEIICSAKSSELEDLGWEHHTGNLPAAYLTGLLAGKRALDEGFDQAVVDLGLQIKNPGTRVYAAIKGISESGVDLNADSSAFPADQRIKGQHIEDFKENGIVSNFEKIKKSILSD